MKKIILVVGCVVFFLCLGFVAQGYAQDANLDRVMMEIESLKKRVLQLENRTSKQEKVIASQKGEIESYRQRFEHVDTHVLHDKSLNEKGFQRGIQIGAGLTTVMQSTHNANGVVLTAQGGNDVTDVAYSVDLEIEKNVGDYGSGFVHIETGDGLGVEDELQVFSNVNQDSDDSDNALSITEAYYEANITSRNTIFTIGKIDPTAYIDNNAYANDEAGQFLGRMFRNNATIEFSDNAPGLRVGFGSNETVEFQAVVLDADADGEDVFNNIFTVSQVKICKGLMDKQGNYRFYGWLNDAPHTKWLAQSDTKEIGYGFGLSLDQELTDSIGVFGRYGWQNPKVFLASSSDFSLEHAWSIGGQIMGKKWLRDDDVFSLGFGQVIPSEDYKDAVATRNANAESHLEAYYSFKVNDHLVVSPDIQVVLEPFGGDGAVGDKTIVVWGTRVQVDF